MQFTEEKNPAAAITSSIEEKIKRTPTERLSEIEREFAAGFDFIRKYRKSVTFYGSARFQEHNVHYQKTRDLTHRISKELGHAIVTGGGPGIMEAANRGAFEAGGDSIGLNIKLPHEQIRNPYLTDYLEFYYFFIRKVMLSFAAEAYVFCPGGFGTLDEFFEIITLVQTNKIKNVPVILMGKDYWQPLQDFIRARLYEDHGAVDQSDLSLYTITDDENEILKIIKGAPLRQE